MKRESGMTPVALYRFLTLFRAFLCALCVLCSACMSGCGADLDAVLAGISPVGITSISQNVKISCAGVLSPQEMQTGIIAAHIDQLNGYTKSEELISVTTNCTLDEALGGVPADECVACKSAILEQVYGD